MNSETERYLERATRGLWGKKRLEVREELEAHLCERVMAHRIAGLGETDAVEKALLELGKPKEVSLGMARLYTFPTLIGSGAVLAAACVFVVALLPKGAAQTLAVTPYYPSAACLEAIDAGKANASRQCFSISDIIWFDQQALKEALEPQGVVIGNRAAPESEAGLLSLTFPKSTPVYIAMGTPGFYVEDDDGSMLPPMAGYLSLWNLLRAVSLQKDINIKVNGWNSPIITFNDLSLEIGTANNPMTGHTFYDSYLSKVYYENLAPDPNVFAYPLYPKLNAKLNTGLNETALQKIALNVSDANRSAYGIAMRLDPAKILDINPSALGFPDHLVWGDVVSLSTSRADAEGNLNFMVPEGTLHFVESFTEELDPGAAILVKLNPAGTNWYEVVEPERVEVR